MALCRASFGLEIGEYVWVGIVVGVFEWVTEAGGDAGQSLGMPAPLESRLEAVGEDVVVSCGRSGVGAP